MSKVTLEQFSKIRIDTIQDAFNRGLRTNQMPPDYQAAPWLKEGLKALENKKPLTGELLQRADNAGGTDHNDPWFT